MQDANRRVKILSEALPYIQRFRDHVMVVKYGGSAMTDARLRHGFARDVVLLKAVGMEPVIVHGGGPEISSNLEKAGIETRFVGGLRVTDAAAMRVVEETLAEVNRGIVASIAAHGGVAQGFVGAGFAGGGGMLTARKLPPREGGEDLGQVGEVMRVSPALADFAHRRSAVPVVAPIGVGEDGLSYNINADAAAAGISTHLKAEKLILLTNTPGLLDEDGGLIVEIAWSEVEALVERGVIHGGMLPKVACAFDSVRNGVHSAHIIDGRVEHALLLELLTDEGVGTMIR